MPDLSHQKIEHAVLWSIVKQSYDGEFINAQSVSSKLLGVAPPTQIQAAIDHLVGCEYLANKSGPMQSHYEPTRRGYIKIEQLLPVKASFVGRLNMHGPKFLASPAANDARLESRLEPEVSVAQQPPQPTIAGLTINNNNNVNNSAAPVIHGQPAPRDDSERLALSSNKAGWFGAWGAWVAAILTGVAILVAIWLAGNS